MLRPVVLVCFDVAGQLAAEFGSDLVGSVVLGFALAWHSVAYPNHVASAFGQLASVPQLDDLLRLLGLGMLVAQLRYHAGECPARQRRSLAWQTCFVHVRVEPVADPIERQL